MTTVVDASAMVSALVDGGPEGAWALDQLQGTDLIAPHLMPVEATNILRRSALASQISDDSAALALRDLQRLTIEYFPFEPFADRVWELRGNVTSYDAWYVGLAEHFDAPLLTLDRRLGASPGPTCRFLIPAR
jgi:predicted nucleic acid-binding protein